MKSLLQGIWYHVQDQGLYPTIRWLCRKAGEQIRKTGYERYQDWPTYFTDQRASSIHNSIPIDEKWTEFICPFHRGDTIVGLLCANAAAQKGQHIRMYVAKGLKEWLSDLDFNEKITLIELNTEIPTALETQSRYNQVLKESIQKPEATGRFVSYRPIGKLEDDRIDLVEYILRQLNLPQDTKLPNLGVKETINKQKLDSIVGDSPFVLFHPQAGWRIKNLRPDIISEIIHINHEAGLRIIQIGGEKDERIKDADGYILENLTLADWAYLFQKTKTVIGVDSWTAHFASMLDVNQILIYGATENKTVGLKRHMEKQDKPCLVFDSLCDLHPCTKLYCRKGGKHCQGMRVNIDVIGSYLGK